MHDITLSQMASITNKKYTTLSNHRAKGLFDATKRYIGKKPVWFVSMAEVERYTEDDYNTSKNKIFAVCTRISTAINDVLGQDICERILEETNEELQKKLEDILKEEFDISSMT